MSRVIALVEGQTEQAFVKNVLAPHLGLKGISLSACLVGRPGHKGGIGEYQRDRRDILAILKKDSGVICTTMFDYYGMPNSWPGWQEARDSNMPYGDKARIIEEAIAADIAEAMGESFNSACIIPYIQMHEFEALLFSDVSKLAKLLENYGARGAGQQLRSIAGEFGNPEEINDNPHTAPSKRIKEIARSYKKVLHGNIVAAGIGLGLIREKCPRFGRWVNRLETLTC